MSAALAVLIGVAAVQLLGGIVYVATHYVIYAPGCEPLDAVEGEQS